MHQGTVIGIIFLILIVALIWSSNRLHKYMNCRRVKGGYGPCRGKIGHDPNIDC